MQANPSIAHSAARSPLFYGWRVVAGAFVLAVFGWGFGFYGPPVFLHAIRETRGWPLSVVSSAITVHFLVGAGVVANLPGLYSRFGVPAVTKAGAVALALGVVGWAVAAAPWQLFAATILSGAGWVALGAAAVNAIVSPWFARSRPAALSMAYNGASIGGVVFSPLWVAAIGWLGFPLASAALGAAMVLAMWLLSDLLFAQTPGQKGLLPDGDALGLAAPPVARPALRRLSGAALWRDIGFLSLVAGTALGLFAQVGLIEHLFSLLAPALGDPLAGVAMAGATAAAIAGRSLVGWLIPPDRDRRLVASLNYAVQIGGSVAFMLGAGANIPLLLVGVVLFGVGIGNTTSLPPLIAQIEFDRDDVPRVVALVVATSQASYAFAPAAFGLIREFAATPVVFAAAAVIQGLAIAALLAGRRRGN